MLVYLAIAIAHTLLVFAAGVLLWIWWRRLAGIDSRVGLIVGIGVLVRSVVTQVLFWISYLRLPIARDLQWGDGFWLLAIDGRVYFDYARAMAADGWRGVVLVNKTLPSPAFLQTLAVFLLLFGFVASVGAVLNLFAYLGTCAAIVKLGRTGGRVTTPALIAVAAVSFAPAIVIWSVQPLKDPFFIMMVVLFVLGCGLWQEAWLSRLTSRFRFVLPLSLMFVAIYAISGTRWYIGVVLWMATLPFFIAIVLRNRSPLTAAVVHAVVFIALSQVIAFVCGPYLPRPVARLLGRASGKGAPALAADAAAVAVQYREGFEAAGGTSMIRSGDLLAKADHVASSEPQSETAVAVESAPQATPFDLPSMPVMASKVPRPRATAPVTARSYARASPRSGAKKPSPAIASPAEEAPLPGAVTVAATPSAQAKTGSAVRKGRPGMPRSTMTRMAAGASAVVLPRFIAEVLGLIRVAGGRGLWAIVEIDTVIFDLLLVAVFWNFIRGVPAGALRNPSFWLVSLMTLGIAVALSYTVSNFGTLFRHRAMIFVGLCLLLVVTRASSPRPSEELRGIS